jgi:hypothetical protein
VIVTAPGAIPLTTPDAETVAIAGLFDDHTMTRPLSGLPMASRKVAESCSVAPTARGAVAGATATDATGTNTLTDEIPFRPSTVAVIVTADPEAMPVTSPLADTVATAGLLDDQLTVRPVTGFPPGSRGVAVSCADVPVARFNVGGDTSTDATAARIVIDAEPAFPSLVAITVTGPPAAMAVTRPPEDTAASAAFDDDHVIARPLSGLPLLSTRLAASC